MKISASRNGLIVLGLLLVLTGCGTMNTKPIKLGEQVPQVLSTTKNIECQYLLYLPADYGKNIKKCPLMLFLHGSGERGDDLQLVTKHGPPKLIAQGKFFDFIVVSPQYQMGLKWVDQPNILISLLDEIESKYRVDTERVYLTGLSIGGFGTWNLACHYPQRFAAIAPICGGGEQHLASRLKNVPVWAFHGAKDMAVPLKETKQMVSAVRQAGGEVKMTIYPDVGHDSWTQTYNNPQLYEWFLSQKKSDKK